HSLFSFFDRIGCDQSFQVGVSVIERDAQIDDTALSYGAEAVAAVAFVADELHKWGFPGCLANGKCCVINLNIRDLITISFSCQARNSHLVPRFWKTLR